MHVPNDRPCDRCHESGVLPGTADTTCDRCGGTGLLPVEHLPADSEPHRE